MRGRLRRQSPREAQQPPATGQTKGVTAPKRPTATSPADDDDEARLLHASLRDVTPLKPQRRAELDTPKPRPVPRHRDPEPSEEPEASVAPALDELSDEDFFRVMMEEVLPQKDDGRIESGRRRCPASSPTPPQTYESAPLLAGILPPDSDTLTPEELFRRATGGVEPIDTRNRAEIESSRPRPEPLKRDEDERSALQESLHTPLTLEDRLDAGDETAFLRAGLPRRTLADLRRGKWTLQGEIDLHGFNRDEARAALGEFLASCLQQGRRFVRVIHGKGLGSPGRQSILKQLSRAWLAQREEILAFCQAGPNQGGSGALLVLLRSPNARPRPLLSGERRG